MKIVILDGQTLNPGDLSWDSLRALGACDVHARTAAADVVARSAGAQVVLTNKAPIDRQAIAGLAELRLIAVTATGYNIVDVAAASERGVAVCNVPEYSTADVAQHTFALLLELTNRVGHHARTVQEGRWITSPDFSYWDYPILELTGATLGIVGYGRIGRSVAEIAKALGMNVLVHRRSASPEPGVRLVDLETLFAESDVVTLHCPLTPENRQMVNAQRLARMKPTAFLINTARGGLVDDAALADALNAGRIAGAGLDVLVVEPPAAENPLLRAKNCYVTPHVAWSPRPARERLLRETVKNIEAFVAGRPRNRVTP